MTEKQWLRSANPESMNDFYDYRHTERKARLLMLACCCRHPEYLQHEAIRPVVNLLTAHYGDAVKPDTPFDGSKIRSAYRKLEEYASTTSSGPERGLAFGMVAAAEPVSAMKRLDEDFEYLVFSCVHDVAFGLSPTGSKKESKQQASLFRDIVGNPYRSITRDPAWLTSTVVSLAQQLYTTQDFSPMPILADALQDAGCENEDVLSHCRDEGLVHVRGCWVVDLLLGKA